MKSADTAPPLPIEPPSVTAEAVCLLNPNRLRCPLCDRQDTMMAVGDHWFCAACGYASVGISGCT